jgi:hypothetical protein
MKTRIFRAGILTLIIWLHQDPIMGASRPGAMEYAPGFSTFFGTSLGGAAIVTDQQGSVYLSGTTRDPHFPTTRGAYSRTLQGDSDAFVAKFSTEGQLLFSTLIGGSQADASGLLRVDDQGNVYVAGNTSSPDFPTSPWAYQRTFPAGQPAGATTGYVLKLDPSGSRLLFSTFLLEGFAGLQLDNQKNILLSGNTAATNFPAAANAFSRTLKGDRDAFVCRLSADGSQLLAATLFGGRGYEEGKCLAVDSDQNVYLAGCTGSTDLPVATNALKKRLTGTINGYFAKFDRDLTTLLYSSYYGGSAAYNFVHAMYCSPQNQLYLSGQTYSTDVPVTTNAYQTSLAGDADLYISVVDGAHMTLRYSSYFGGTSEEMGPITPMGQDLVVVSGMTKSPNFQITEHAWLKTAAGAIKPFFAILDLRNAKAKQLVYSTFWPSEMLLNADEQGNIYLFGETSSTNYLVTPGAFQTSFPGAPAFFLTKLVPRPLKTTASINASNFLLSWSGGVPPYLVQQSATLGSGEWHDAVTNAVPPVNLPLDQPAGYYRVASQP